MFNSPVPGLKAKRISVFLCCFLQYAMLHSCRSTWSYTTGILTSTNDKYDDQKIDDFDKSYLADVNFAFLFTYGSSMLFLGQIGDRIGPKRFMLYGTFMTGIIQFLIAGLFHIEQHNKWLILMLMIFNGVAQAPVWPGLMAIMNNWQSKPNKVIVMGYFTACTNIGNILGDFFAYILIEKLDLIVMSPIYVAAAGVILMSIINVFAIPTDSAKEYIASFRNPNTKSLVYKQAHEEYLSRAGSRTSSVVSNQDLDVSKSNIDQSLLTVARNTIGEPQLKPKKPKKDSINMFSAWKLPNVALYAFAFGCVKAVFYILAFWLPNYLSQQNLENISLITQMIEWGTIPGGILIWYLYFFNLVMLEFIGTFGHFLQFLFFGLLQKIQSHQPYFLYYMLVFLTGLLIGGVYNNISGAIVIELTLQQILLGNKKSTATVTSVVMGYGATFAAINQLIVPHLESKIFLYCGLNAIIAGMFLIPLIVSEYKRIKQERLKVYDK
ncbi:unnamed protein product (macronuclear) [Paramecium tetraurelia]|uniref:Major facilitator superfamily (MFS) profile domain-containing protein n=1 Tax=Paramecium tetraurelia TaxID=5888 RepID=A0EG57_PARTE|nr:uncharacterized protein GSPATT00026621001 [Paramecium tetraurelia]CAK94298.1 unnamed protein product [Paramecium tetraurelia]|eukprot:XP_001461671.1 hypothetical protein (macronuclear) [Paramecium tetraurelia strain d4-2]